MTNTSSEVVYPRLNITYTVFIVAVLVGVATFFGWTAAYYELADWGARLFLAAACLFVPVWLVFTVYRASRLRVTNRGISCGRTQINWSEVTSVKRVQFGIHVQAGDRKIVFAPYAYQNPEELVRRVEQAVNQAVW